MDQCTSVMEDPQFWLKLRTLIAEDDQVEATLLMLKQIDIWKAMLEASLTRMN